MQLQPGPSYVANFQLHPKIEPFRGRFLLTPDSVSCNIRGNGWAFGWFTWLHCAPAFSFAPCSFSELFVLLLFLFHSSHLLILLLLIVFFFLILFLRLVSCSSSCLVLVSSSSSFSKFRTHGPWLESLVSRRTAHPAHHPPYPCWSIEAEETVGARL